MYAPTEQFQCPKYISVSTILVNTKSILFFYAKHSTNIVVKVRLFAYSLLIPVIKLHIFIILYLYIYIYIYI